MLYFEFNDAALYVFWRAHSHIGALCLLDNHIVSANCLNTAFQSNAKANSFLYPKSLPHRGGGASFPVALLGCTLTFIVIS